MSRTRILSLLVAALVGLGLWQLTNRPETISQFLTDLGARRETQAGPLAAAGFIEAREIAVAGEFGLPDYHHGGRVITLTVDEGDTVLAGQLLLALDTTLLDAQIEVAAAAVEVSQAQRDQVAAGVGDEALGVAEAEVARAQAVRDAAYRAWQDAITLRDNPQELNLEIAAARAQLQVAEHQLAQVQALRDAAAVGYERFGEVMDEIGPHQRIEIASGPLPALAPLLQYSPRRF